MNCTPFEIKRRRVIRELPDATLESMQLLLAHYISFRPTASFVQIGACDGVSEDPVHGYIRKGVFQALLVEPIPANFRQLRQSYEGVKNVRLAQVAIGDKDGEANLFKVKEGAKSVDVYWSRQLASFDRSHLLRHGVSTEEIECVRVPSMTLSSLIAQHGISQIDLLQVDTEGFDAEVVGMSLRLPVLPECINFENVHLKPDTAAELFSSLKAHGYVWTHDAWNTLAVHQRLLEKLLTAQ